MNIAAKVGLAVVSAAAAGTATAIAVTEISRRRVHEEAGGIDPGVTSSTSATPWLLPTAAAPTELPGLIQQNESPRDGLPPRHSRSATDAAPNVAVERTAATSPLIQKATYIVKAGDTLSAIASRFGTTVASIARANHITNTNVITVGTSLVVSGSSAPAPSPPKPPTKTSTTAASWGTKPMALLPGGAIPPGAAIDRIYTKRPVVALTFDDGPNGATTDAIVATLNRNHVKATFFVVGQNAAREGARLASMSHAGHVIANHSWDHPELTKLSTAQIRSQLHRTSDVITTATGQRPTFFRAPYGAHDARVDAAARLEGMRDILWDVDTVDWSRPGSEKIVSRAVNQAHNGSIILMHDGGGDRTQTAAAVQKVIDGLHARGYEIVTVPQLISDKS